MPDAPGDEAEAAFLAAIRTENDSVKTRNVYADWLEERGDAARSEYLRLDLALAARTPSFAEHAARLTALHEQVSAPWRDALARWVGKTGFTELSLTETVARLSQSGHPAAKAVADAVTEFVEALAEDDDDPSGRIKFFDRNVAVSGDFIVSRNPVIVLGDLVCGGQYTDLVEADQSLLAVAGELRCRSIWQLGDLFVAGQVTCAEVFYGASYHSNRSEVLGDVKAHALVENGHHFVIHGSLETAGRIGRSISVGGRAFQDDGDVSRLKVELVGEGGAIDEERLYQLVCAGESILKKK